MIQKTANFRNFPRVMLVLAVGLCLFSACASPRVNDQPELDDCRACENIPGELYWDVDDDGQDDFVFIQQGKAPAVRGPKTVNYSMVLRFIDQESKSETPSLLYPLEPKMVIGKHTKWNKGPRIKLGNLNCWDSGGWAVSNEPSDKEWDGAFTGPDGGIFAFRLDGEDANKVGVARIRLNPCDGWVDILNVRIESERYGIIVGE